MHPTYQLRGLTYLRLFFRKHTMSRMMLDVLKAWNNKSDPQKTGTGGLSVALLVRVINSNNEDLEAPVVTSYPPSILLPSEHAGEGGEGGGAHWLRHHEMKATTNEPVSLIWSDVYMLEQPLQILPDNSTLQINLLCPAQGDVSLATAYFELDKSRISTETVPLHFEVNKGITAQLGIVAGTGEGEGAESGLASTIQISLSLVHQPLEAEEVEDEDT